MSSKIFWAFASVFLLSSAAYGEEISKAGLFVEPAVTYQKGNSDVNYPAPLSNSTGDVAGFGIGARLGFHINEVVFVGFDGRYSMPNFTDSSVQYDAKATAVDWGPTVGIQMPNVGLRIWGKLFDGWNTRS